MGKATHPEASFKIIRPKRNHVPGGSSADLIHHDCAAEELEEAVGAILGPMSQVNRTYIQKFGKTAVVGEHITLSHPVMRVLVYRRT